MRLVLLPAALLLAASSAFAQSIAEIESPKVNRVAEKLSCKCGCNLNMACKMEPWPCQTCRRAKEKIVAMQAAGKSDSQILDTFVQENGKQIMNDGPGLAGFIGPIVAVALGLIAIAWFVRRHIRTSATHADEFDPAVLARIENEMAKLD